MSKRHHTRGREPSKAAPVDPPVSAAAPPELATFSIDVAPEPVQVCEHIRLTVDRPAGVVTCADCQAELSGELTVVFDGVPVRCYTDREVAEREVVESNIVAARMTKRRYVLLSSQVEVVA